MVQLLVFTFVVFFKLANPHVSIWWNYCKIKTDWEHLLLELGDSSFCARSRNHCQNTDKIVTLQLVTHATVKLFIGKSHGLEEDGRFLSPSDNQVVFRNHNVKETAQLRKLVKKKNSKKEDPPLDMSVSHTSTAAWGVS